MVDAALRDAARRIGRTDAQWLLLHVLGRSQAWLFAHADDALDARHAQAFEAVVARREAGEPVAYLTGRRGFRSLELEVAPGVLIPRPETELLVELALERIAPDREVRIADLGTGSGAIALAVASERPQASIVAVDASMEALSIATGNARRLGLANVSFHQGDWWQPLAGDRFDIVVANPPYISEGDPHLAEGDLRFEPAMALASGADGLDAIREIVAGAPPHLVARGWLLLEHGWEQGEAVRVLLQGSGFVDVETRRDLEDRERVTLGQCVEPRDASR